MTLNQRACNVLDLGSVPHVQALSLGSDADVESVADVGDALSTARAKGRARSRRLCQRLKELLLQFSMHPIFIRLIKSIKISIKSMKFLSVVFVYINAF